MDNEWISRKPMDCLVIQMIHMTSNLKEVTFGPFWALSYHCLPKHFVLFPRFSRILKLVDTVEDMTPFSIDCRCSVTDVNNCVYGWIIND